MGGGYYEVDVAKKSRSAKPNVFNYQGHMPNADASQRGVHELLNARGKVRECLNPMPVVIAMDVTRSRGDDTKMIYAKLPMFMGQIELKGYIEGAAISFAAVGDADSDVAPLQVGQFEADNRLDDVLSKIWLEEGGGGTGQESYELAAYYYARHTKLDAIVNGTKGYFFFLGDEGFYPNVSKAQVKKVLGYDIDADIPAAKIFAELQQKFHVFLIYPKKTMSERKGDIDAEIKKRVTEAGGRYEGVDIRASLIWDNTNDLDLHVITPAGEHIYYGHKQGQCGGWLDVDMNVRGETTKPVENVQWKKGTAPAGTYKIYVQNYRFHQQDQKPTNYRVELEINGRMAHFDGVISPAKQTGPASDVAIHEFRYDPSQRQPDKGTDSTYDNYSDEVILKQWSSVIPPAHVLQIEDPKAIIDVMLGVLAISSKSRDLDGYLADMAGRDQQDLRREQAAETLGKLANFVKQSSAQLSGALPTSDDEPTRGTKSKRL